MARKAALSAAGRAPPVIVTGSYELSCVFWRLPRRPGAASRSHRRPTRSAHRTSAAAVSRSAPRGAARHRPFGSSARRTERRDPGGAPGPGTVWPVTAPAPRAEQRDGRLEQLIAPPAEARVHRPRNLPSRSSSSAATLWPAPPAGSHWFITATAVASRLDNSEAFRGGRPHGSPRITRVSYRDPGVGTTS